MQQHDVQAGVAHSVGWGHSNNLLVVVLLLLLLLPGKGKGEVVVMSGLCTCTSRTKPGFWQSQLAFHSK